MVRLSVINEFEANRRYFPDNFGAAPTPAAAPSGYGASTYDSGSYGASAYGSGAYGGAVQNGASGGYGDTYAQGYGATSSTGYAAGYGSMNGGGMGSYGQEASGFGPTRGELFFFLKYRYNKYYGSGISIQAFCLLLCKFIVSGGRGGGGGGFGRGGGGRGGRTRPY